MVLRFCAAICGVVIVFAYPLSAVAKVAHGNVHASANDGDAHSGKQTAGHHRRAVRADACATGQGRSHCASGRASTGDTIVGAASMYDPFGPGSEEGGLKTASGERYDPVAWTAAIKTGLRRRFGGIRHGKDYQPAYALIKVDDKQAIIKINDVGPLRPGRVIDFSKRTMRYFDPSLQLGVLQNVRITPLPGDGWSPGPING